MELPFEHHRYPWDESVMGRLYIIPNFYSDSELEYLRTMAVEVGDVDSDTYPNRRVPYGALYPTDSGQVSTEVLNTFMNSKVKWLYENWEAFSVSTEVDGVQYCKNGTDIEDVNNNVPDWCNHHMQCSPKHMRPYPIHNDGGKLMTILVPIYPDVNNSTIFHGNDRFKVDTTDGTMIPWNINEAYMFRSSSHSWHSYVGGESDRFIMNINFFNNWFKR